MNTKVLRQYAHTIRYLRPKQLLYRIRYLVPKRLPHVSLPLKLRSWQWHAPCVTLPGLTSENTISFLNETLSLDVSDFWQTEMKTKLWLYHLHYFDDLNAIGHEKRSEQLQALMHRWIDENPPLSRPGWEPYPSSLRVVNWTKWLSKYPEYSNEYLLQSLALQAEALYRQVEYHILGNHLFANAKALTLVGAFFDGKDANRWFNKGLKLLDREIPEQFLSDGGHFELSPMYHTTLLWDMCDLYQLAKVTSLPALQERQVAWEKVVIHGLNWLKAMTHPDGQIAFFNDATFGMAPTYQAILDYAHQLGIQSGPVIRGVQHLKATGYITIESGEAHKLLLDVGHVGPDYQPGHAHADTLGFELSLFGQRVLVNSGISEYGTGTLRQYQRSTKAHNTVSINHENSSEVWSGFRVARRARPLDLQLSQQGEEIMVRCGHNGYQRLSGKNIHERTWCFESTQLTITDCIEGEFQSAEARFYLHPEVNVISVESGVVHGCLPTGERVKILGHQGLYVESSKWYPGFNLSSPNKCIVVPFDQATMITQLMWDAS